MTPWSGWVAGSGVTAERLAILKVGGVASAVMIVLSLLLASTIAGPVRRLADSAERVRRRIKTRVEIPDFTRRRDEIGHLSGALRDMTDALYNRIEAIEAFAADVSHELKNPLTSLKSAVEMFERTKHGENRERLEQVLSYDEDTAGGLMTTEYISVRESTTRRTRGRLSIFAAASASCSRCSS